MSDQDRREEIRFRSGDLTLAGTFTLPPAGGPAADGPVPAVLMLPGSGRTDRDGNAKPLAVDVFPQLSAAIRRHEGQQVGAARASRVSAGAKPRTRSDDSFG